MNKYLRIMHPTEARFIQVEGVIPTCREAWGEHKSGSVVFLFEGDQLLWKYVRSRAENIFEGCGEAIILSFEAYLPHAVDKSGWDIGGAVVHEGPIQMSNLNSVRWFKLTVC